jgi:hypothetical protein
MKLHRLHMLSYGLMVTSLFLAVAAGAQMTTSQYDNQHRIRLEAPPSPLSSGLSRRVVRPRDLPFVLPDLFVFLRGTSDSGVLRQTGKHVLVPTTERFWAAFPSLA